MTGEVLPEMSLVPLVDQRKQSLNRLHLEIGEKACDFIQGVTWNQIRDLQLESDEQGIITFSINHFVKMYQQEEGEILYDIPWGNPLFKKGFESMQKGIAVIKMLIGKTKTRNLGFDSSLAYDTALAEYKLVATSFVNDLRGLEAATVVRKLMTPDTSPVMSTKTARLGALLCESLYYQTVVVYSEEHLDTLRSLT